MSDAIDMARRIYNLEQRLARTTRPVTATEQAALQAAQSRADAVAALFGTGAPPPKVGELPIEYRRRLLQRFAPYAPRFKDAQVKYLDDTTLSLMESEIYADAASSARSTAARTPGRLTAFEERDRAGRLVTTYHGDVGAFLKPFVSGGQTVRVIRR